MQYSIIAQLVLLLEPLKRRHFAFFFNSELKENKKNLEKKKFVVPLPLNQNKTKDPNVLGPYNLIHITSIQRKNPI